MDQNNFNGQNPQCSDKEPLSTMNYPAAAPVYQLIPNQPVNSALNAQLQAYGEEAFKMCLASAIMSSFPVASIIAIVMGSRGLKIVNEAYKLATSNGVSAGGKNIAAKVLGLYGRISGIVYTVMWGFWVAYFAFILFVALMAAMAGA